MGWCPAWFVRLTPRSWRCVSLIDAAIVFGWPARLFPLGEGMREADRPFGGLCPGRSVDTKVGVGRACLRAKASLHVLGALLCESEIGQMRVGVTRMTVQPPCRVIPASPAVTGGWEDSVSQMPIPRPAFHQRSRSSQWSPYALTTCKGATIEHRLGLRPGHELPDKAFEYQEPHH